jgi:Cu(I)/Ag(I) efflux system membrane fusion protein
VTTGLRGGFGAGGRTEIVQGLAPGDVVVASAQFLIDSESALSAGMTRFAPTEAEPAAGRGEIVAVDAGRRRVTIAHEAIDPIGWPAMTTAFTAQAGVALDRAPGEAVRFALVRGSDGLLSLSEIGRDDGIEATGTGMVRAVTPEGKLDLAHDPIPALGWPAMEMEMPVAGLDPASVPTGVPVEFDLAKGEGGTFVIVGLRGADGEAAGAGPSAEAPAAPPLTAEGTIEAIDPEARTARIAHGPIAAIGMPGMTMDFALAEGLDPAALPVGEPLRLVFARPDGTTMVLEGTEPAAVPMMTMSVEGTVHGVDPQARTAEVTHGPLVEIGMPGMTMAFPLAPDLDPEAVPTGEARLVIGNDPERGLVLVEAALEIPPMRVRGTVDAVDPQARTATLTHGPIAEIGMPGMTMAFPLGEGVEPSALPVGEEVTALIRQGEDLSLTLVGLAGEGAE